MSILNIYIDSFIGNDEQNNVKGFMLEDVVRQVTRHKEPYNLIKVNLINTPGGDVEQGMQISDYLNSLGVSIHTHAVGLVASISSVIFMQGDKRTMEADAQLMIHNPYYSSVGSADADYLEYLSKDIRKIEKSLNKIYANKTGLDNNTLSNLMKNETFIDSDTAFDLGFTTEKTQKQPAKAVAFINNKKREMSEEKKSLLNKIAIAFGIKAMVEMNTSTGDVLIFDKEEGEPVVGDKATINGEVADGSYLVKNGTYEFIFTNGELTEIKEVVQEEESLAKVVEEMLKPYQEEIDGLKAQVKSLKKENEERATIFNSIKQIVSKEVVAEKKEVKPTADPIENKSLKLKFK